MQQDSWGLVAGSNPKVSRVCVEGCSYVVYFGSPSLFLFHECSRKKKKIYMHLFKEEKKLHTLLKNQ